MAIFLAQSRVARQSLVDDQGAFLTTTCRDPRPADLVASKASLTSRRNAQNILGLSNSHPERSVPPRPTRSVSGGHRFVECAPRDGILPLLATDDSTGTFSSIGPFRLGICLLSIDIAQWRALLFVHTSNMRTAITSSRCYSSITASACLHEAEGCADSVMSWPLGL